jgi:hypothetical protein
MTKARDIASAAPAPSTVSATELGYVDGVTSAIQTQVDAKTAKSTLTTTGDIYYASAANTPARLGIGSTGNVLTVASGIPSWAAPGGASGLTLIQRSTFSNVAGTGTTFDGTFSSTYVSYLICIENCYSSTQTDDLQFVFRYSATDETSHWGNLLQNTYNATTFASTSSGGVGQLTINSSQSSAYPFVGQINVSNIGTSTLPAINGMGMEEDNTKLSLFYGYTTSSRTYTGFRLKSASSNITGTVAVYGLAK